MRCLLRPTDYTTHGTQCSAHSLIKKKRTQEYKNLPSFIILEKKNVHVCILFPLSVFSSLNTPTGTSARKFPHGEHVPVFSWKFFKC